MTPAQHKDDPWYGKILLQVISREGMMTTLVTALLVALSCFGWKYGGATIEANNQATKDNAEANRDNAAAFLNNSKTNKTIGDAFAKLAESDQIIMALARATDERVGKLEMTGTEPAQRIEKQISEALDMMRTVPAERKKQTVLLQELVDGMKATAEELRGFRKNEQTSPPPKPPPSGGG